MRFRSFLSLALFAAATACSAVAEGPTAVETPNVGPAFAAEGLKPPPPLGTQETSIDLESPSSETPYPPAADFAGGPSAESALANQPFSARVFGRYFANTQGTNGWIAFVSGGCVIASPNAKLQYNEKSGRTSGHGTLTACNGVVLDLSKIEITDGGFGGCTFSSGGELLSCRSFTFTYDGSVEEGTVVVSGLSED